MSSKEKHFKIARFYAFWILLSITFILSAGFLIIAATGYQINYSSRSFEETGIIDIKTTPKQAIVYVNGKPLNQKTPVRLQGVSPDLYELKIEKAGHNTWQKSLQLEGSIAYNFTDVVLFRLQPEVEEVVNVLPDSLSAAVPDKNLLIDGGEIWYKENLVTRLSRNIDNAIVYPDKNHIVFQVRDEIRVLEIDGGNNTLLVKLEHSEKTVFGFQDSDTLLFQDGDTVKQAKIL